MINLRLDSAPIAIYDETFAKSQKAVEEIIESKEELQEAQTADEVLIKIQDLDKLDEYQTESNNTIQRLHRVCQEALEEYGLIIRPNYTGRYKIDFQLDRRIETFKKTGVYEYALQIKQLINGLIKYSHYNPNLFGEQNIDLKIVVRDYKAIYDELTKAKDMVAIRLLHELITCVDIILKPETVYVEPKTLEPTVTTPSELKEG